ncbi:hypothetical protein [Beijerinckia sp. L45]|uniref:hypothetical protein n=1 Tax=Beijerinckia sp. L45 TaxID=1641855 RepID=UPI00131BF690|nr:hypothetical protein [Beijerinckia sp. L45]
MFKEESSFIDLVLTGTVDASAIDYFVNRWHAEPGRQPLHTFLGMTPADYALWAAHPDQIDTIVESHRGRVTPLAAITP